MLAAAAVGLAQTSPDVPPPQPKAGGAEAPAPQAPPPDATPLRPFTAFSWHPTAPLAHIRPMVWFHHGAPLGEQAKRSKLIEPGCRVFLNLVYPLPILNDPRDVLTDAAGKTIHTTSIWPDHAVAKTRARWTDAINWFADAGGEIDLMVLDFEGNYSCWALDEGYMKILPQDPRWPDLARQVGVDDPMLCMFGHSRNGEYLRWNAVMGHRIDGFLDDAIFAPMRKRFARAGMLNFGTYNQTVKNAVPDLNGHFQYTLGDPCGTHQSPAEYGGAAPHGLHKVVADFDRPFMQVVYAANFIRGCARSSAMPMVPWVAFRSWRTLNGRPMVWGNTDYWQEGMYHIMLSGGTSNLIYWNPTDIVQIIDDKKVTGRDLKDDGYLEAVMADIQKAAGDQQIVAPATLAATPWDAKFVISAAKLADGSVLARVTFAEDQDAAGLKVGDKVLRVERPAGKLGAWVRLPG